jgi:hypothetical protein
MATATTHSPDQTNGQPDDDPPEPSHDATTLARIVSLNLDVTKASLAYDHADRVRKAAKEELEDRQSMLNEFIAGLSEEYPLFPDEKVDEPAAVDDDSWRDTPIAKLAEFGLADSIVGKLEQAELLTMGELADWSARRPAVAIKGLGTVKMEQLDAALDAFWRGRRDAELAAGCREVEASKRGKSGPSVPQDATGWRETTIGELGLAHATVDLLDAHVIPTVGELVVLMATVGGIGWLDDEAADDIEDVLDRFRNRMSNARIADFDAARRGMPRPPDEGEDEGREGRAGA